VKSLFVNRILFLLLLIGLCLNTCEQAFSAPSKPTLLKGSVNQLLVLCSSAGITLDKDALPARVSAVKLGTSAAYFGLDKNDQVLSASVEKDQLNLKIDRSGQKFFLRLPISASALRAATNAGANRGMPELKLESQASASPGPNSVPAPKDTPEIKQAFKSFCISHSPNLPKPKLVSKFRDIRALEEYDFVLLVDHSGSMGESIHGNKGSGNFNSKDSKWHWVQEQMLPVSREFVDAFKKGIRLVMFDAGYDVYGTCSPIELANIFHQNKSGGGTNLTPPLREELKRKIVSGKPLIICIFTDGENMCHYDDLRECIAEATQAIPGKYDLAIHFFIVNPDEPDREVRTLKSDLMAAGAKFDVVHIKSFGEIEQKGLINTLIDVASSK